MIIVDDELAWSPRIKGNINHSMCINLSVICIVRSLCAEYACDSGVDS